METVQIIIEAGMLVALSLIAANTAAIARKTGSGGNDPTKEPPTITPATDNDKKA